MARGSYSSSSHSQSSSRKVCSPNKFSFMSGCMSWSMALAIIAICALLIVCFLIMSNRNTLYNHHPKRLKSTNIIVESRNNNAIDNIFFIGALLTNCMYPIGIFSYIILY